MNTFIICLSLKYINNYYESTSKVSKWIHFELEKCNYYQLKFIKSLDKKDFEIIKTLIKFNEDIDLLSNYLIKYCSDKEKYFNIVKLLIDNGADIHTKDDQALIWASYHGYLDIVKFLIDNGANVNTNKDQALLYACGIIHIDMVKLLIDNGANVHARNNEALRYASANGHREIIKLLLDNGEKESFSKTPGNNNKLLTYTNCSGFYDTMKLFI